MTSSTNSWHTSGSSCRWRGGGGEAHHARRLHDRSQRGADARAGAVQQHALVAVADVEQLAGLGGAEPDQVPHRDHRALLARQPVDGREQVRAQLAGEQARLRVAVEPRRRARPASVGGERRRLHGGLAVGLDRREGQAPGVADGPRAGAVDEDAEDPRPQRRAALEPVEPAHHAEPGLLHDVVDRRVRVQVAASHAPQGTVVPPDQRVEGLLVARAQAREQRAVVVHRIRDRTAGAARRPGPARRPAWSQPATADPAARVTTTS